MIIFVLLEFVFIAIALLIIVTQVLVPLYKNRPLFPLFRKETKIKNQIVELEQSLHESDLSKVVQQKTNQLKKKEENNV